MSKLVGFLKEDDRPFTGSIIVTALNGVVQSYSIKSGKPKDEIELKPGYYNIQLVSEEAKKQSSYPQYKWRIPDAKEVDFDKIESEALS